jgi:hypothetical protein
MNKITTANQNVVLKAIESLKEDFSKMDQRLKEDFSKMDQRLKEDFSKMEKHFDLKIENELRVFLYECLI